MNKYLEAKEHLQICKGARVDTLVSQNRYSDALEEERIFNLAIETLDKAIPQKIIMNQFMGDAGGCPRCNKMVIQFKDRHFHSSVDCGQALDWSELDARREEFEKKSKENMAELDKHYRKCWEEEECKK